MSHIPQMEKPRQESWLATEATPALRLLETPSEGFCRHSACPSLTGEQWFIYLGADCSVSLPPVFSLGLCIFQSEQNPKSLPCDTPTIGGSSSVSVSIFQPLAGCCPNSPLAVFQI